MNRSSQNIPTKCNQLIEVTTLIMHDKLPGEKNERKMEKRMKRMNIFH